MQPVPEKIVIKFLQGALKGDIKSFQQSNITIGRSQFSDVVFDSRGDKTVSNHHAVIRATERGFELSDVHSTNGTFLNGKRIQAALLYDGDVVRLGALGPEFTVIIQSQQTSVTAIESVYATYRPESDKSGGLDDLESTGIYDRLQQIRHRKFIRKTIAVALATGSGFAGFAWTLIEGLELSPAAAIFRSVLSLIIGGVLIAVILSIYHGKPGSQRFVLSEMIWIGLVAVLSISFAWLTLR